MTRKRWQMRNDPWARLGSQPQHLTGHRAGGRHALDIYWIKSGQGAPGLLLRRVDPACVPYSFPKPRGFTLDIEATDDACEARMFLRELEEREVFLTLCRDVIAYSASEASAAAATRSVFRRLSHWHSLMSRARTSAMAPHEIRGLIGELFILERLIVHLGFDAAITAWVAPDDHPQDFVLDSRIVEVKTRLSGGRQHVQISSLEQLESTRSALSLVVVEVARSESVDATTLNQICERIEQVARGIGSAQEDALHVALLKRGYTRLEAYDNEAYRVVGLSAFNVRSGFPKLARADVDLRIPQARYVLDLALVKEFEVDPSTVIS